MKASKRRYRQSGFTILETMVALIIMISALTLGGIYMKNSADNRIAQTVAQNLQQLTQAAQAYARDNYATLKEQDSQVLTLKDLTDSEYISENFPNKNSFQQGYVLTISKENSMTSNPMLRLTVKTDGGEPIPIAVMKKIAALTGGDAGYAEKADVITGNQKGWDVKDEKIAQGRLATVNYITSNDVVNANTFLRRNKLDGHPEWNKMETDLGIGDNNITFEKGQVLFNDSNIDASLSASQFTLNDGGESTDISAGQITLSGARADSDTMLTNAWIKPPTYLVNSTKTLDIYELADDTCGGDEIEHTGKIFTVGSVNNNARYLFMCGKRDGYEQGKKIGRAYMVASSYGGMMVPSGNTCNNWDPVTGPDGCLNGSKASDNRAVDINYLKYSHAVESHYHNGAAGNCRRFARTEKSAVCVVATKTIFPEVGGTANIDVQSYADQQCKHDAIDNMWGGELNNVFISEVDCDHLKYHN